MSDSSSTLMKRCSNCDQIFPATLEHFYSSKGSKSSRDGLYPRCKTCVSNARRKRPILPEGFKKCPRCNQILPQTLEYFFVCRSRPDGLTAYCKTCQGERQLELYQRKKEKGSESPPKTMFCSRCRDEKLATLEFFSSNPLSRYGLSTTCRVCTNLRNVENSHKDIEKTRHKWRMNYLRGASYYKSRYLQKRIQILDKQHLFQADNPEIVRGWKRRYAMSDRGHEISRVKENRRRARKRLVSGTYTPEQIQDLLKRQKHKCYYCHKQFKKSKRKYIYHIEHTYPLSRVAGTDIPANDISYLVLACPRCNQSKGDKFPWEWEGSDRLL